MLRSLHLIGISALLIGLLAPWSESQAQVTTIITLDDFENPENIGQPLPDAPLIGLPWMFNNPNAALSGWSKVEANPAPGDPRNTSSTAMHMQRFATGLPMGSAIPILISPFTPQNAELIGGNRQATIEFKYYEKGGAAPVAGNGVSLIANQQPTPGTTPGTQASTGIGLRAEFIQFGPTTTTAANFYTVDQWHDIQVNLDFATQRFTMFIDETQLPATTTPYPFTNFNQNTVTNVWMGSFAAAADWWIDDFRVTTTGFPAPATRQWGLTGSGVYGQFLNWQNLFVPNTTDHVAAFGSSITAPSTIIIDSAVSVNGMTFNNSNTYALSGNGEVTLGGTNPFVTATSGNHEIQVKLKLAGDTTVNGAGGSIALNNQIDLAGNTLTTMGSVTINNSIIDSAGGGSGGLVNEGTLAPLGSTFVGGDFTNYGTLALDPSAGDKLDVLGSASLAGSISVYLSDGTAPTDGMTILTAAEGIQMLGALTLTGPDAGLFSGLSIVGNSLVLNLAAVPEPATVNLFLMAVLLGSGLRTGRHGQAIH
jgi:hypothetical protein